MITDISTLMKASRPPMLIEGFIPRAGLVVLAAPAYTGKTYFALEMARAVSRGVKFLGQYRAAPGRVLIIEGDSPDWDLAQQYDKLLGLPDPLAGPEELEIAYGGIRFIVNPLFGLNTLKDATELVEWMKRDRQVVDTIDVDDEDVPVLSPPGFDLVIIDTLRAVHQGDENSNKEMQDVLHLVRHVIHQTRAAVVVLHHFNKQFGEDRLSVSLDRLRGATAIGGGVDGVFALQRLRAHGETVKCHVLKNRAAPHMRDFSYYQLEDETQGRVELTLSSPKKGTAGNARDVVLEILQGRAGEWVEVGALVKATLKEWDITSLTPEKLKSVRTRVNEALVLLAGNNLIQRGDGTARYLTKEEANVAAPPRDDSEGARPAR